MNSYILKNSKKIHKVLLYQEKNGYTWVPKKECNKVTKVTVLDKEMVDGIFENKVIKKYNRLLQIIYSLVSSDDTTSGDVLVAHTELERIREYLFGLKEHLSKSFVDAYTKKLYALELKLKKVQVMELEEEIEKGKSR